MARRLAAASTYVGERYVKRAPDDLYRAVKDRGLPASDLLRRAVQAELRRQTLLEETAQRPPPARRRHEQVLEDLRHRR